MRTLDRKLLRDLRRVRGQAIAIGLIIACGVASWVTVLSCYRGLKGTRDAYYRQYRMADLFAVLKKAPRRVAERLERIDGVRQVRPRIVFDVSIDLPDVPEPCFGRTVSLPDARRAVINDVHLAEGKWFTGDGTRQVIVGDRFAKEHRLRPGDRLPVLMNNRKEALVVVATALSPEYVYMIRGAGDFLPDPRHFTVLWISESFAESVFDFEDAANDFVALLDPRAAVPAVKDAFDRELGRYGGWGAYARADQLSHRVVNDEIEGLKGTATLVPAVFLGVAAFVLHMLLSRLVRTQRTQVAVFRAFGYSTRDVAVHYLKLALLVGTLGCAAGTVLGLWFARSTLEQYREFYQFPLLRFRIDPLVLLTGAGVTLGFAALGALSAALRAARLEPAEGLRPEAPGIYRRTRLEGLPFLWKRLGFVGRMVVRNVARAKARAALTIAGVALSASIVLLALFTSDTMDELLRYQNRWVDRQDALVTFGSERGLSALYEVRRLPGVRRAEPELVVPVELVRGHRVRRTALHGLPRDGVLRGLVDREHRAVPRPEHGLLLTRKLAELLRVEPGQDLNVRVLEGRRQVLSVPVEGTVDEYLGAAAYADLGALSRWLGEEPVLNSVRLLADEERSAELSRRLKDLPAAEAVTFRAQSMKMFRETLVASMRIMTTVLTLFAGVIAFGVIYNASRIALAERERTLASLRVLGFSRGEVGAVLHAENLLLAVAAIPPGLGLGALFSAALARLYDTDLYRFPLVITPRALLLTAFAVVVFAAVANLAIRRRIRRLDLVEALKSRE